MKRIQGISVRYIIMPIVMLLIASMQVAANDQAAFNFDTTIFTNYCGEILVDKEMVEKISKMEDRGKQEIYLVQIAKKEIDKELKEKQPSRFMSECLKKTTAIRLLGEIPGTNYIEVLIHELSYADPNMKRASVKYPAFEALVDKGEEAETALWHFLENAQIYKNSKAENVNRIRWAVGALKEINKNNHKRYYKQLQERKTKIDNKVYRWFLLPKGGLYDL